jgi:hypothetical protein
VTSHIPEALSFFCEGLSPMDPFPMDRQWISPANNLVKDINQRIQHWRSRQAVNLGVLACKTLSPKTLAKLPGTLRNPTTRFHRTNGLPGSTTQQNDNSSRRYTHPG